jgi:tetratricopeptide (TPR) repeat protein
VRAALPSAEPLAVGRAHAALAHCHVILGDVGAALPLERRALLAYEEAGDPRRIATAHGNLAYYLLALGRYDEAVRGLERAAALSRTAGNRSAEGYALHNLGLARVARAGAIEEGLADEDAALAIAQEVQEPRLELACRQYRAAILLEARRSEEALPALEEALRTPEDIQGNLAPQLRGLYASALVATGRLEDARAAARQAIDLREAAGGMSEFEAELFVAAHEAGIAGALERGKKALEARAARISDPEARRSFLERVPAHLRLEWLARSTGTQG